MMCISKGGSGAECDAAALAKYGAPKPVAAAPQFMENGGKRPPKVIPPSPAVRPANNCSFERDLGFSGVCRDPKLQ